MLSIRQSSRESACRPRSTQYAQQCLYLLAFLYLFCVFTPAKAKPSSYCRVELLIFKQNDQRAWRAERWRQASPLIASKRWIELRASANLDTQSDHITIQIKTSPLYRYLPASDHQLTELSTQIEKNGIGEILFHHSWYQSTNPSHTATVYLTNHQDLPSVLPWRISGTLLIRQHRYADLSLLLHFCTIDISELPPISPQQFIGQTIPTPLCISLHQHRRTPFNQINYLDHPLFGVILLLTPATSDHLYQK